MKNSEIRQLNHHSIRIIQLCLILVTVVGILFFVWHKGGQNTNNNPNSHNNPYPNSHNNPYLNSHNNPYQNSHNNYPNSHNNSYLNSHNNQNDDSGYGHNDGNGYGPNDGNGYGHNAGNGNTSRRIESFTFDPNTADSISLLRLGLEPYQIRSLLRYRAKGGTFHRPEQFKKLYGLTVEQWHHLQPLIRISDAYKYLADTQEAYNPAKDGAYNRTNANTNSNLNANLNANSNSNANANANSNANSNASTRGGGTRGVDGQDARGERVYGRAVAPYAGAGRDTVLYPNKLKQGQTIEINRADTNALKRIPGIGGFYARKIVQYREKLGGFTSLDQLDELEDLPLGIEAYLTVQPKLIRKIKLNQCTVRQLNAHPYINYQQAKTIADHVRTVGPIRQLKELGVYDVFSTQDLQRLEPYAEL